jgi:hypothetical protein
LPRDVFGAFAFHSSGKPDTKASFSEALTSGKSKYNSITYDRFRGYVTAWPQTYPSGGKDATVVLDCVDAFALFAMREKQFSHGVVASGTRIDGLLNQISWPAGWKSLDAGIHNVAALDLEFSSILEEIHRTVLVEQGLFYINGAGLAVFKDGNTRIQDKTSVVATFADDGTNIGYEDLNVSFDDTQLWNDVTVSRTDGVSQNVFDATSVNADGEHDLHLSDTLNVSDGEAYALAGWLLLQHKEMIPRAPSITFRPEKSPATAWPVSLGLDYLDRIRVKRTAIAGDDIDVEFHLEGVTQDVRMVGGRSWATTFQLSPVLPFNDWWILGTSQLGSARIGY